MKRTVQLVQALAAISMLAACALAVSAQQSKASATQDDAAIRENIKQMETGWNTKSGALFAKPFAEDADYVVINGMHIKGRAAIDRGHQQIFDTIYKNTSLSLAIKQVRFLRPDVALVHVSAHAKTPQGDGFKESSAMLTTVMTKDKQGWKIAAFQNTEVSNPTHQ